MNELISSFDTNSASAGGYSRTRLFFSKTFCISLLSMGLSGLSYYLLNHLAYYSGSPIGGTEVFMLPRFAPSQNGLNSGVFRAPWSLFFHGSVAFFLIFFAYFFLYRRIKSFAHFLGGCYLTALLMAFNFLGFTQLGFRHLALQTISLNNGIWFSMNTLLSKAEFSQASLYGKAQFIFSILGHSHSGYTIPGTTHPPGLFFISFILRYLSHFTNPPVGWGILITGINCSLVVVIGLLARSCFSLRAAKSTCLLMLTVPSVCLHFNAMIDIIPSVAIASGFLMISQLLKLLRMEEFNDHRGEGSLGLQARVHTQMRPRILRKGLATGFYFTLAAQFTYGHSVPIGAALIALLSFCPNIYRERKLWPYYSAFFLGLSIFPLLYFLTEFILSDGTSFWLLRAILISREVANGLNFRPYALSQFSNFVVMSIMGGILWFTGIWILLHTTKQLRLEKQFVFRVLSMILLFLLFQSTVRLEVERTWHWAFILPWTAMGTACLAFESSIQRLFLNRPTQRFSTLLLLCVVQLTLSISLAISVQDYY